MTQVTFYSANELGTMHHVIINLFILFNTNLLALLWPLSLSRLSTWKIGLFLWFDIRFWQVLWKCVSCCNHCIISKYKMFKYFLFIFLWIKKNCLLPELFAFYSIIFTIWPRRLLTKTQIFSWDWESFNLNKCCSSW